MIRFIKHKQIKVNNYLGEKLINKEINWPLDGYIWEKQLHINNYLGDKIINKEINWSLASYNWEKQLKSYKENIWKTN